MSGTAAMGAETYAGRSGRSGERSCTREYVCMKERGRTKKSNYACALTHMFVCLSTVYSMCGCMCRCAECDVCRQRVLSEKCTGTPTNFTKDC